MIVALLTLLGVALETDSPALSDRAGLSTLLGLRARGAVLFATTFTPSGGLGPLFNRASCVGCHARPGVGGMGPDGLGTATRVGELSTAGFDPMTDRGGPIARSHSVAEQGHSCDLVAGIPPGANITSVRNAPDLHGTGLIDAIPEQEIAAGAVSRGRGVHGRPHWVMTADGRVRIGRFGWKATTVSLRQFVADAFRNELGITSRSAPVDLLPVRSAGRLGCSGEGSTLEADESMVDAVTAFVASLSPPLRGPGSRRGAAQFHAIGCTACHTPSLLLGPRQVPLYSDLLLHDMGPELDDKVVEGQAGGREWRTTPLWGLGTRPRLLHDGRAHTITEAILAHGGEADATRQRFALLPRSERAAFLAYLAGF
jgi:CxxC motif-containing protein (DUF1111 family)